MNGRTPMRIIFAVHQFFPHYSTGTEVYTLQIAREMRRRGYDVTIVVHEPRARITDDNEDGVVCYHYDGFPVHAIHSRPSHPGDVTRFAYDSAESEQRFATLITRLKPDLVHFTHFMRLG